MTLTEIEKILCSKLVIHKHSTGEIEVFFEDWNRVTEIDSCLYIALYAMSNTERNAKKKLIEQMKGILVKNPRTKIVVSLPKNITLN